MTKSIHTSEYATLRQELRAARQWAGLSQRGLAARLKVTHSWVAKVETGERRVDVIEFCWFIAACGGDPLEAIARVLGRAGVPRPSRRQDSRRRR
jgi:transcriptional regulator with XRE-family HTH domain